MPSLQSLPGDIVALAMDREVATPHVLARRQKEKDFLQDSAEASFLALAWWGVPSPHFVWVQLGLGAKEEPEGTGSQWEQVRASCARPALFLPPGPRKRLSNSF